MHEIWQENKRWIVGVLIGVVLFFIAKTVLASMHDSARVERQARGEANKVNSEPMFDANALAALREESEALSAAEKALLGAAEFAPRPDFDLKGKGSFHLHFDQVSRQARTRVLVGAERAGVDLGAKDLQWPTPTTQDETQSVLVALDLLDDAMARAFAASQEVRAADPDAVGLVAVDELRIEGERKVTRGRRRSSDASDRIKEYRVTFKLRADAPTVIKILESFKSGGRPINLANVPPFKIVRDGKRPNEPLTVSGSLVAMRIEPRQEGA
ncbi:MAG: hypothetical protein R3F56_02720 [Planctomycetota bacterium]